MEPIAELEQTVEEGVKAVSAFRTFLDRYGWSIVGGVVILAVGLLLATAVRRMIKKVLSHERFNTSAAGMISQTVYIIIIALTLSAVLGKLGVPMTSFVAVMGAVGVGVGLALKDTLSNVAAGLIILFFRPFRVGDTIEEEGKKAGIVTEIQIMHTILVRVDGCKVVIPNSEVCKSRVINYTESLERRIDLKVQISYSNDYQKAISLLKEVFEKDEAVLSLPETVIGVLSFDENGVILSCMPWVKGEDYWTAYFRLMGKIKDCFDKNRIEFPYPQRVVHLAKEDKTTGK